MTAKIHDATIVTTQIADHAMALKDASITTAMSCAREVIPRITLIDSNRETPAIQRIAQ
jgi:hypothetical protein